MPRIFDNIEEHGHFIEAIQRAVQDAYRADFCVGYFNLRGWKAIADGIERWAGGENACCRVLIGMQGRPEDELRSELTLFGEAPMMDNATAVRLRKQHALSLRDQLTYGAPTNQDQAALQQLARQLRAGKVVVKLYLRHRLHAKLYLFHRHDNFTPLIGYLGSSNLTFAGLSAQGELNIDVLEQDAAQKLVRWFEGRWNDRFCLDITDELAAIIEESWARPELIPPYHIYLKMAYHLSQEARTGQAEFRIPPELDEVLFDFQKNAVKVAAHHLNKRGGVLIGDVVGLGKTLMATAVARIMEEDFGVDTLILCPPNLQSMWQRDYVERYRLRAKVLPTSRAPRVLPELKRYRLVIIDESHNLRNREGKTYRAIREYLQINDSMVVLLSATPYNKTYLDLSSQLGLFIEEDHNLGIRPEQLLREIGEAEFVRRYQAGINTLAAFEKSPHADDWRELMRLFMVRRTRSFIQNHYARTVEDGRKYLPMSDGTRSYFPTRRPRTVSFDLDGETSQYAYLYDEAVVDVINHLHLPRYGLAGYLAKGADGQATPAERALLANLSRAGRRLMGFCRTNLYKRLESSGQVFLWSLERHILRNFIYLYALEQGLPLPIGTQDAALLDTRTNDVDVEAPEADAPLFDDDEETEEEERENGRLEIGDWGIEGRSDGLRAQAKEVYNLYRSKGVRRFKWLPAHFFTPRLAEHLRADADALLAVLMQCGAWRANEDEKLAVLLQLLQERHPHDKVLIFTQFADTVTYLTEQLHARGVQKLAGVTGESADPAALAHRFSPRSNHKHVAPEEEIRVLVATDVLSEGQNLQDCHIVVNYDLAWAIIRLIQRAGRVDRIGQLADEILCYTFLPAEGVEKIIKLRARVRQRLQENAEVVGTDELFFEDEGSDRVILNLYNEDAGILDDEEDNDVDLASYAFQIWQNAVAQDPTLERKIPALPNVSFAARRHIPLPDAPEGVIVYLQTQLGNDVLAWVDPTGRIVSESHFAILNAARCTADEPALERAPYHHDAVRQAITTLVEAQRQNPTGGQLGRPSGARFRTYERLKAFADRQRTMLWGERYEERGLYRAIEEIYRYPLRPTAIDTLNRQLKSGISDEQLADLVLDLRAEDRLCIVSDDSEAEGVRIVCSLGMV
ncbi:MAG TPA: NgoFVII family restriction endonuclease [Chloroflexi bacterium]|nr:NgoFVII family restriction endonuclease [Chloroflexota bacterium]